MMEFLTKAAENWEVIVVGLGVAVASADKLAIVIISTMKNVRDAWYTAFPKKYIVTLP
jgi:hypothetical protein